MSDKMNDKRLLPCPFCGGRIVRNIMRASYEHDRTECLLKGHVIPEKYFPLWNTRKPMERIVERLDSECKKHCDATRTYIGSDENDLGLRHLSKANAFCKAIEIVKDEGGV